MIHAISNSAAENYQLFSKYESLRAMLLDRRSGDHLDKPLAFWALPSDKRLPTALLGQPLGVLLSSSFDALIATPGIGPTKIRSMLMLMARAANNETPQTLDIGGSNGNGRHSAIDEPQRNAYDPATVSEALWSRWQATVRAHGAGSAKLGCLAPSLRTLPTVVWHTPLEFYLDKTLAQVRALKTHGAKRVRAVLEVFYTVHTMLAHIGAGNHIAVRLVPKFVPPIEAWIDGVLAEGETPSTDELHGRLVTPLLNQIDIDATQTHYRIAAQRLAIDGSRQSVRGAARRLGVTRARVYQLLENCGQIMQVRWPEGRAELGRLSDHIHASDPGSDADTLCTFAGDLFYPSKLESRD